VRPAHPNAPHDLLAPIEVVPLSNDVVTVLVRGALDMVEAGELRAVLADACAGNHHTVIVDLSAVSFIGSSGMGVLALQSHELAAEDRTLQICGCPSRLRRAFEVSGLDQVLDLT
jgi:anti-sigma B factor antagonist